MNRLHRHAPISRAALASMTGLNKSTVSSLANELIERKFVREVGITSSGIGRPSVLLELNPQAGYIVSAEIGVGFLSVICASFTAKIIWHHRENVPDNTDQQVIIVRLLSLLREASNAGHEAVAGRNLLGIAVAIPGLVNQREGALLFAPNLTWRNVPIRAIVQRAFVDIPVFVDNEANMAALGEYFFGAAQGHDEVLYLSAGVGLGGAIVRNGQLVRGATGYAGEFGHMTMYPDGELCACGNRGCWETRVGQAAAFRNILKAIKDGQDTSLRTQANHLTVQAVVDAARTGDNVALSELMRVGRDLGIGIASLVNVLNPDLVLIGGIVSLAGEILLPVVKMELRQRALQWNFNAVKVALAQHGLNACVMGGVAVVYQTILSQPGNNVHVTV